MTVSDSLHTIHQDYLLYKIAAPCMLIGGPLSIIVGHDAAHFILNRALFMSPVILTGLFFLTFGEVRLTNRVLYYRRFRKWTQLHYAQIDRCSKSAFPGVAFFTLDRRGALWHRFYFVAINPLFARDYDLVGFINERLLRKRC